MKNIISLFIIIASVLTVTACNQPATSRVAIIDLNRVAEATGENEQVTNSLSVLRESAERQLTMMQDQLRGELQAMQEQLKTAQDDNKKQQLLQGMSKAQQDFHAARQRAGQQLTQARDDMLREFRERLQPVANDIARKRGMHVVLIRNDALVLSHSDVADITDEVIKALGDHADKQKPDENSQDRP